VWEEEADEAISCEKEHQEHGVSAVAQEILQGGDAVVDGLGGGTPEGTDWRKKRREGINRRHKADKLPQVRTGGSNTKWTLAQAVVLCAMCFFRGKNGAVPYPADSKEQIAWWEEQKRDKIHNCRRTIFMDIAGCPPGTNEYSPKITSMQSRGKTAEVSKKRKYKGDEAKSTAMMGRNQTNSVEGVAIHLLLVFFRAVIPVFDAVWEVMPVFDGLEADFMMRRKDWFPGVWVPMQMKSVSECVQGKQVSYKLAHGDYPNVFCVCVGMLGFVHRTDDVTGPNDITNAPGCSIGEIWNIGSCAAIEKSLGPTFGMPYSKLPAIHRLHFPGATEDEKRTYAEALLRDIGNWPTRLERNRILYEISATINSKVSDTCKIEKAGFEVVDASLHTHGLCLDPVWRQNECVDYVVSHVESGEELLFVSGKTGTVSNDDCKQQRTFHLKGAPNKCFCDVVVASYSGMHHRVAVIRPDTAYVDGKKSFYWNEDKLDTKVRIFDDIRKEEAGKAFVDYILSFRRV
jgi:hypothetical protein